LRFPQRELGFHEKNPEGQAIIFGTGIIRNSNAKSNNAVVDWRGPYLWKEGLFV
jgi:hypothetical protein